MDDMAHALHRALDGATIGIVPFTTSRPRRRGKRAIVAQGADDQVGLRPGAQPPDQVRSYLSGRACNQKPHLILPDALASSRRLLAGRARRQGEWRMIGA